MGLVVDYQLFGAVRKGIYIKITEITVSNRDTRSVRVLYVSYLKHKDRIDSFNNHTGSRMKKSYIYNEEDKEHFFTDELIMKNGLFGEAYRFLKSLEEFEGAEDA